MGVKNFDIVPWREATPDEITGTIAVDVPNYLTRRTTVVPRVDMRVGRLPLFHISAALSLIKSTLSKGILPFFIFDGPPEQLKRQPNPDLIIRAQDLYDRFVDAGNPYDDRLSQALWNSPALRSYFSSYHVRDLAKCCGIPWTTSPSEAEMFAAALSQEGSVLTVLSNDVDALLFGASHVTRSIALSSDRIERALLLDLLESTDLRLHQLRDLAVICGCDFYPDGIHGLGPRKGILALQRHGTLDGVLRSRGYTHSERQTILKARESYDEVEYLSTGNPKMRLAAPLLSKLETMLIPVFGCAKAENTCSMIMKLWKGFGKQQTKLEQWYS